MPADPEETHTAIYVGQVQGGGRPLTSCTCPASRKRTCRHLERLSAGVDAFLRRWPGHSWPQAFSQSVWYRLARVLFAGGDQPLAQVNVSLMHEDGETFVRGTAPPPAAGGTDASGGLAAGIGGEELFRYYDASPSRLRFLERTGKTGPVDGAFDRAALLDRLALFHVSPEEQELRRHGARSQRQAWEESLWHRLAYHAVREHGLEGGTFHPAVELASGRFTLTFRGKEGREILVLTVPRNRVEAALRLLREAFPEQEDLQIRPVPLEALLRVGPGTELDPPDARPVIAALKEKGSRRLLARNDQDRYRYGNLIYLRPLGILAELERDHKPRRFREPPRLILDRSRVPSFLDEHRKRLTAGTPVLEDPLRGLAILRDFERLEIAPGEITASGPDAEDWMPLAAGADGAVAGAPDGALARSWYWLGVDYDFGKDKVSLARLLEAKRAGQPYCETAAGWVDLSAPAFRHLDRFLGRPAGRVGERGRRGQGTGGDDGRGSDERLAFSAGDLVRLAAETSRPVELHDGDAASGASEEERRDLKSKIEGILAFEPTAAAGTPRGMTSKLRPYQERGVEWLRFLYEHRLGGLLADDMGLGKTHQSMALLLGLAEEGRLDGPCLVVAPTSVLPHWGKKLAEHAPGLRVATHHGPDRRLSRCLDPLLAGFGQVILTSYGVLRRDAEELSGVHWSVVIFDEIQQLKNRSTIGYRAARSLEAEVKIGLTGTPIENSLDELKALFDLVLPGYLGSDSEFEERYGNALAVAVGEDGIEPGGEEERDLAELRRLVAPFVLRRLKSSVLHELPEKFEDLRTCELSEDQIRIYREVVETRGRDLAGRLASEEGPVPYIHVFAVLNLLKQVCDHPALALKELDQADEYQSGKWDLFREILDEALGSGHKVVVFSQYLGMIELMTRHLRGLGVGFATLTGASTNRGESVERFNRDPSCKVFLASLKAGGTGIDLVGGSVVIHYDRWWNAAREDQATDRVHRMGQKRAVQVIKLLTSGTLEEKIAALIEAKRRLAEHVIEVDDPRLSKLFSREELLSLLAPPGEVFAAPSARGAEALSSR